MSLGILSSESFGKNCSLLESNRLENSSNHQEKVYGFLICRAEETHNFVKFRSGAKTSASKSFRLLLFKSKLVRELKQKSH